MSDDSAFNFTATCFTCGRTVRHTPKGQRWHGCRLRFLTRRRWDSYRSGWHEGYRFAVEHPSDPLVLTDGIDYGTGWAGHMRAGGILIALPLADDLASGDGR